MSKSIKTIALTILALLFIGNPLTASAQIASDCPGAEPSEILKEEPVGKNILPIKDIEACLGALSGLTSFSIPSDLMAALAIAIENAKSAVIDAACNAANTIAGKYVGIANAEIAGAIATAQATATGAVSGLVAGATGSSALGAVVGGSIQNSVNQNMPGLSGGLGLTSGSATPAVAGPPPIAKSWVW